MKRLSLALLCLLTACGSPLNLGRGGGQPSSPGAGPVPTLVPGMVLYYDAAFVSGSYGVPSSPCGATTWTDLTSYRNDGSIAGFTCTASSGFTGAGVYQAVPVDFNQWQHVAVTYTPTNIYVYKNGQKYTYPGTPTGMATNNPLTLGANPAFPAEGFNGGIAYLTVYDRALSDAEISQRCLDLKDRFSGVTYL